MPLYAPSLTVEEEDASPSVAGVKKIQVANGSLTNDGGGIVSIATGSGSSAVVPWAIIADAGAAPIHVRAFGAANRAMYLPCVVPADCTLTGVRISVVTSSGNISVGLYDSSGSRVATSGAVACPATGLQSVSFTGNYSATAGRFYLAMSCDNTTATFAWTEQVAASAASPASGRFEASAHPLPATATFSQPASTPVLVGLVSGGHP